MRTAMRANGRAGMGWVDVLKSSFLKLLFHFFDDWVLHRGESDENVLQIGVMEFLQSGIDIVQDPFLGVPAELFGAMHFARFRIHDDLRFYLQEIDA